MNISPALDFSRCRKPPFAHQREDVASLMTHPFYFLANQMRTGKSKTVVDAAQLMFEVGIIDKVLVVAPAPVRDVWYDPVLGQIAAHSFIPTKAVEYHAKLKTWSRGEGQQLEWYVTNFEFIRSKERLRQLMPVCGQKTLMVIDESSFVKNHASAQTKACLQLRRACGRIILLNGTPIFHTPMDLFSQGNILHPSILECPYVTLFRARYAIQEPILGAGGKPLTKVVKGGKEITLQQTVGWKNLDDLQRRFAPYTVRRLQKDCLDLPPKLDPVVLTATLNESWSHYKAMRDQMVIWLKDKVAISGSAAIKVMRLAQITSGFVGGVEDAGITDVEDTLAFEAQEEQFETLGLAGAGVRRITTQEVGREKLDLLLWFIEQQLEKDENVHLVAWCHFRPEMFRIIKEVEARFPQFEIGSIQGGQKREERLRGLSLLKPETTPKGPTFVAGVIGTGSFGLDMCAAHTCITVSDVYSPGRSSQTLDRVYGPGQTHPIAYYNIVAAGPKGQRTIDHDIVAARMSGENVATRTADAWVRLLKD